MMNPSSGPTLLGTLTLASLLLIGCNSDGAMSHRTVTFDEVEDVLGDTANVIDLVEPLPQSFLAGDGSTADQLFLARRTLSKAHPGVAFHSVLDVSALDEAGALAVSDAALDEALEIDGLVLIDHKGSTARVLRDSRPGIWLLRINAANEVVAEVDLGTKGEFEAGTEDWALGIAADQD